MSNRIRKRILLSSMIVALCTGMVIVSAMLIRTYRYIAYDHISAFCEIVAEDSPEIETQMLVALKEYHAMTEQEINGNNFLGKYGYRAGEFCMGVPYQVVIPLFLVFLVIAGMFVFVYTVLRRDNKKNISDLTEYLERINTGAAGTLIQTQENDFSHLQDEIYKTVTSLYQTRETAIEAKKNYADNLANIAHQLKTPITAAFLSLQLMKENDDNKYVNQIEKQLERLNCLEESLLTLSKIDAGALQLKTEKIDIYTVLCLAAENLSDLLEKDSIVVEIPENGCIEFSGDLEWTMEALINVFKNCMEHSEAGKIIHCDYSSNPLYSEIRIWDDGTGFDSEDIPHLFERFYRGRQAIGNGIGIGLALTKSIFELQNGTITAYNLHNGGACFEIRIYSH